MTRVRRVAAAAGVAAVFMLGGGGAAFAADPTPAPTPQPTATEHGASAGDLAGAALRGAVRGLIPGLGAAEALKGAAGAAAGSDAGQAAAAAVIGDRCKILPTVGTPTDGLAGRIDPGPSHPGTGFYSTYGWGGLAPVIHDPGCPVGLDLSTTGMQKRVADPANSTAGNIVQAQVTMLAAATQAAQIVLEPADGLWQVLTPLTSFVRYTMGYRAWLFFFTALVGATALWHAFRAGNGDTAEAREKTWKGAVILAAGAITLAVPITAGSLVSQGVTAVYSTMATGTASSAGQAGASADAAIGDVLWEQIVWPTYVDINFGADKAAADKYAMRLFAASAMTRAEQAQAAADPSYAAQLDAAKKADYLAVAKAYKAEFPATYERTLAGSDTSERPWKALLGAVGAFPAAYFLLWTLFWIGAARLALELVVAFTPAAALVAQFPECQWMARAAVGWLTSFFTTAFAATVVYVAFTVGVVGGILSATTVGTMGKFGWMLAILIVARMAWRRGRTRLYARTGVDQSARGVVGVLRQILRELQISNRDRGRGGDGSGTQDAGRPGWARRRRAATDQVPGQAAWEPGSAADGVAEQAAPLPQQRPVRFIPAEQFDTEQQQQRSAASTQVVRGVVITGVPDSSSDVQGPRIRRLPDTVDTSAPGYAPRVNKTPPDSAGLSEEVRVELARARAAAATTITKKEQTNVLEVAAVSRRVE